MSENQAGRPFWPRLWYTMRPLAIAVGTFTVIALFAGMLVGNHLCFVILTVGIMLWAVAMGLWILRDRWKEYK